MEGLKIEVCNEADLIEFGLRYDNGSNDIAFK